MFACRLHCGCRNCGAFCVACRTGGGVFGPHGVVVGAAVDLPDSGCFIGAIALRTTARMAVGDAALRDWCVAWRGYSFRVHFCCWCRFLLHLFLR